MKKTVLLLLATALAAVQAPAAPADLARDVVAAAARKADLAAPIAKTFDEAFAKAADSKAVKDALFENASAVGAVLPTLDAAQAKAAVEAVMKGAEAAAKAVVALDKLEGDDAADALGKCYALAAAALANVLPPDGISKDVAAFIRELVPEAYADQVAAAFDKPADALGAVQAANGREIAAAVSGKPEDVPVAAPGGEFVESASITTSTTTTTTTTTTSTTQVVIVVNGQLVDAVTLQPVAPVHPVTPPKPIVPPTRPSPTPVGRR